MFALKDGKDRMTLVKSLAEEGLPDPKTARAVTERCHANGAGFFRANSIADTLSSSGLVNGVNSRLLVSLIGHFQWNISLT